MRKLFAVIFLACAASSGPVSAQEPVYDEWAMPRCNGSYQPLCSIDNERVRVDCQSSTVYCDDEGA